MACVWKMKPFALQLGYALDLGVDLCHPHRCPCGATVDAKGIHGLLCKLAADRMPRHQALNDLIWRARTNTGVPSTKEPSGMSRTDGKRPGGLTLIPWQRGKSLVWDVTVVNTLTNSLPLHCLKRVLLKWRLGGRYRNTLLCLQTSSFSQ